MSALHLIVRVLIVALLASVCHAADAPKNVKDAFRHTFMSCSMITSEHLTALQLYQRGLPLEAALKELPNISDDAKKRVRYLYDMAKLNGILNTYSDINTNYARCAKLVHDVNGKPDPALREFGYYFCSGENKIRFEILLLLDAGKTSAEIMKSIPDSHFHVLNQYQKLVKDKGTLAAFDFTANNLKACLSRLQ